MRWDNEKAEWVDERSKETVKSRFAARVGALVFIVGLVITFLGFGLFFSGEWWVLVIGIAMAVGGDSHRKWYWKNYRKTYIERK